MKSLHNTFTQINRVLMRLLGWLCAFFMGLLCLVVLWGVATRYLMGSQASFTEEMARMLLIILTFLGGAYAFGGNSHIGLDLLATKLSPSARRICGISALCVSLFFALAVLVFGGIALIDNSISSANRLVSMPFYMWQIYLCIPISGVLSASFIFEQLLNYLNQSQSKDIK